MLLISREEQVGGVMTQRGRGWEDRPGPVKRLGQAQQRGLGSCYVSNFYPLLVSSTSSVPGPNLSWDLQSQDFRSGEGLCNYHSFFKLEEGRRPLRSVNSRPCKMKPQCWPILEAGRTLGLLVRYDLPGVSLRGWKLKKDGYLSEHSIKRKPGQFCTPLLHAD